MLVGRDNNTYFSIGATETGNSGGRIRAVTASVKAVPIGQRLWTVTVTNASSGPITDLEVDVYGVDGEGNRLEDACHPAKGKISVQELFREILSGGMSGTLDAIGSRAQSMYPPGMVAGMPANLGAYGGMFTDHILAAQVFPQFFGTRSSRWSINTPRSSRGISLPRCCTAHRGWLRYALISGSPTTSAIFGVDGTVSNPSR